MIAVLLALLAVVNSPYSPPTYACNGVTATFTVNFPYRSQTDLVLTSSTAGVLVLTADYTVSLVSSTTTASVTLTNPAVKCPSGTLKITRITSPPQKYAFGQQTTFNTNTLELSEDAIVYQVQEAANLIGSSGVAGTVTADAPLTGNGSAGSHLQIPKANASTDGYLFQTDWTTFNNKAATGSCAANNFVVSDTSTTVTCAQPVVANISDIATNYVQLQATTPGSAQVGNINITGKLIVNGSSSSAVVATGSGANAGLTGTGGGTSGVGLLSTGGAPNGGGATIQGTGNGFGANINAGSSGNGIGATIGGGNGSGLGITGGLGASISAGASGGNAQAGAAGLQVQASSGTNATSAGPGGVGGTIISTLASAGGNGNGGGAGGAGGTAINVGVGSTGGTGGATGAGGAGGRVLVAVAGTGTGGTGGATSGTGGGGSGGSASAAIDITAGAGGSPGTPTGTGGPGGNGALYTAGAGGSTSGAGTGGTGGIGSISVGGNGGATVGGTGGTGGVGGSHTGGNGAANNGGGGIGDVITGGNAVGTGSNGTGATIVSGSGGTGAASGVTLQLNQTNAIRAYINFGSARAADPTTRVNGDLWTINDASASTSAIKWNVNSTAQPILSRGANGLSAIQTLRVAGCATAASLAATCTTVVTWPVAFPDANYTASCTGDLITSGVPGNGGFTAKAAASVTFQTVSFTAAAAQYTTLDCYAIHD